MAQELTSPAGQARTSASRYLCLALLCSIFAGILLSGCRFESFIGNGFSQDEIIKPGVALDGHNRGSPHRTAGNVRLTISSSLPGSPGSNSSNSNISNDAITVPGVFPDLWVTIWSAHWCLSYLKSPDKALFFSTDIFYPAGSSLLLHNLSEGIFIPLALIFGDLSPEALYLFATIFCMALNGCTAFALFYYFTSSTPRSLWLAALWAFHPFFVAHIAGGHLNQLSYFTLPLAIISLRLIARASKYAWAAMLGLILLTAWAAFLDYYQLFILGIVTLGGAVLTVVRGELSARAVALRIILPALLGCAIAAPKLLPATALMMSGTYTPNHNPAHHGADLVAYLVPGQTQALGTWEPITSMRGEVHPNWAEGGLYLGWSLLIFLGVQLTRVPRHMRTSIAFLMASAAFAFVLSFGPRFTFRGEALFQIPLVETIFRHSPLLPPVPARFAILGVLFLLSAVAVASRGASRKFLGFVMIVSTLEMFPAPPATTTISSDEQSVAIAHAFEHKKIAYVLDLGKPEQAMYRQIIHGQKLVGGFLARRPRAAERMARNHPITRFLQQGEGRASDFVGATPRGAVIIPRSDNLALERARRTTEFEEIYATAQWVAFTPRDESHER